MTNGLSMLCVCVAITLLCAASAAVAQQPSVPGTTPQNSGSGNADALAEGPVATLRITTRLVEISAVVRDKAGEPQKALTQRDFVLKVDGREEPIQSFGVASDLPLTLVLMVDVSGSQRTFIGDEWRASDVFFETMLTDGRDRAALVQIDARVRMLRAMTNSVGSLHLALTQLGQNPSTSGATLLNDAVEAVSREMLSKEKGRKAIVLLTDGGDNGSRATLAQAIEQAQRANVPVYAVNYTAWAEQGGGSFTTQGRLDPGRQLLETLAQRTGGRVYTVSPSLPLQRIFAQIGNDLRTQYEIGYRPGAGLQPGSFHKLELRTNDRHQVVQARSGFFVQP